MGNIKIFFLKKKDFGRKKRIFRKIFCSMRNLLELQCLVDDLDEVDMGRRNEKKNCYIKFISFLLKNCYG